MSSASVRSTVRARENDCTSVRRLALGLILLAAAEPVAAHPVLDDRLIQLDEQIAEHPEESRLYLSRGARLLDEGHVAEALADFDRALERDLTLTVAYRLRAEAFLAARDHAAARTAAQRFLDLEPQSARGWRVAARIDAAGGDLDAAGRAFARFFALVVDPRPDDYLELATVERRAARPDAAILALEAGLARLGPLTSLLTEALEIERSRGRFPAALAWADRLAESSPQTERWQLERARLLRELRRIDEAHAALDAAAAVLASRSEDRRSAPAFLALAADIEQLRSELPVPAPAAESAR